MECKVKHFMATILAEKSRGSKFDPQILAIWTSTLHCSGDCDFMVTIVTMHLSGMLFRQNSVKSLIRMNRRNSMDFAVKAMNLATNFEFGGNF